MAVKRSGNLVSFPVSMGSYKEMVDEIINRSLAGTSATVCIANVHMMVTAHYDQEFASVVKRADLVTPDGLPLTWAMRFVYGIRQERVAGMDMLPDLIRSAEQSGIPVFFYGGTDDLLNTSRIYLSKHYPKLAIAGTYSPPFRPLSVAEEDEVTSLIKESGAKLIFVVLGCPKQEKWMDAMKEKLNAVMVGVGGALPVMVGLQKRAPLWMQKSGLEWLYRLAQEPQRLFGRYAVTNSLFIVLVTKEIIRRKLGRQKTVLQ